MKIGDIVQHKLTGEKMIVIGVGLIAVRMQGQVEATIISEAEVEEN